MGIEEVVLIMKKIGRLIYRLAMAMCVFNLMIPQDIGIGSSPYYPYLAAVLFGCCVFGAFFETEEK